MNQTFKNFREIASLYEGSTKLEDVAVAYQSATLISDEQEQSLLFAVAFVGVFKFSKAICREYYNLTEEDNVSYVIESLLKSLLNFSLGKAKFLTFFAKYLKNKLREETQYTQLQKRKANNCASSVEEMRESESRKKKKVEGSIDDNLITVDTSQTLHTANLTDNEIKYCHIIMKYDKEQITSTEIAQILNVSSSAISQMKQGLRKKLAFML